jgi:hypothetical protein
VKLTYLYIYSMAISFALLILFRHLFQICPHRRFHEGGGGSSDCGSKYGDFGQKGFCHELVHCRGGIIHRGHPDREYRAVSGVDLSYIRAEGSASGDSWRGLDSILGAIIGGLIVGVLEFLSAGYLDPYIPAINEVFPFIVMVLVLMIKPYGLFGIEEIERV